MQVYKGCVWNFCQPTHILFNQTWEKSLNLNVFDRKLCVEQHLLLLLLLLLRMLTLATSFLMALILFGSETEVESYRLSPELLPQCGLPSSESCSGTPCWRWDGWGSRGRGWVCGGCGWWWWGLGEGGTDSACSVLWSSVHSVLPVTHVLGSTLRLQRGLRPRECSGAQQTEQIHVCSAFYFLISNFLALQNLAVSLHRAITPGFSLWGKISVAEGHGCCYHQQQWQQPALLLRHKHTPTVVVFPWALELHWA